MSLQGTAARFGVNMRIIERGYSIDVLKQGPQMTDNGHDGPGFPNHIYTCKDQFDMHVECLHSGTLIGT